MTKDELLDIQQFIIDLRSSEDAIEVLEGIYTWAKKKYEEQGEKKLCDKYIKPIDL